MDDTLVVEIEKTMEDLSHVQPDEVFRKLAEVFAYAVQRAVFTVPAGTVSRWAHDIAADAYSRIMYSESAVFTKPWYWTMFGCCDSLAQLALGDGRTHVKVF